MYICNILMKMVRPSLSDLMKNCTSRLVLHILHCGSKGRGLVMGLSRSH